MTATWDYVLCNPRLHSLLAPFQLFDPRSHARIVLLVHTGYDREVNSEPLIQHDVEVFVEVDSKG